MLQEDQQISLQYSHCVLNLIISGLLIIELSDLKDNGQEVCFYIVIGIWCASAILGFLNYVFYGSRQIGKFQFFIFLILHSEWLPSATTLFGQVKYAIIQMMVITFPISVINIYLLSDTTKDYFDSSYVVFTFLNEFFMGIVFLSGIGISQRSKTEHYFMKSIPQICLHFSYWYILIQSFYYNYIIGLVFLTSNCIFLFIELVILFKQNRSEANPNQIFLIILKHLFQFNCAVFSTFSKYSIDFHLNNWIELRFAPIQCLNVVILFILKMVFFPKIINADIGLFILLFFSSIQIYLVIINIYYKGKNKANKFSQLSKWNSESLCVSKNVLQPLLDDFIFQYSLDIELEWQSFTEENQLNEQKQKKIISDSLLLSKLIHKGVKISFKNSVIKIFDPANNLNFTTNYYQSHVDIPKQELQFSEKEEEFRNNMKLLNILNILIDRETKLIIKVHKKYVLDIYKMIIQMQMYNNLTFTIMDSSVEPNEMLKDIPGTTLEEFNLTLSKVKILMLQALIFKKELSVFLQINPNEVFYDLYDQEQQIENQA